MLDNAVSHYSQAQAEIVETAISVSRKAGFTVSMKTMAGGSPDTLEQHTLHILTLKSHDREYTANIQIRTGIAGPRLHHFAGFPPEVQSVLLNLPPFAGAWANTEGGKADRQSHPDLQERRGEVAAADDTKVLVDGIKALLDIAALQARNEETRRYIGASGIGVECQAYQALSLRGFKSVDPDAKLARIFRDGHRIEDMVVEDLVAAGLTVEAVNPETGKQWRYTANDGHHIANLDGFVTAPGAQRMTLEIKSMNKDSFTKFVTKGLKESHPRYYAQMQDGIYLANLNSVAVSQGMMVAYCKDNSSYHVEIITADRDFINTKIIKVVRDVMDGGAKRVSKYEKAYDCATCFKREACWHPEKVTATHCSQCAHSVPGLGGSWWCNVYDSEAKSICPSFKLFTVTP